MAKDKIDKQVVFEKGAINPSLIGGVPIDKEGWKVLRLLFSGALTAKGRMKMADADRYALLTQAQALKDEQRILSGDLEYREGMLLPLHRGQQEENLVGVAKKAMPLLEHMDEPSIDDNDWKTHWLELASRASDDTVQQMFASILAGKVEDEGSFSKRTMYAISQMSKAEIENWIKFSQCVWVVVSNHHACYWLGPSREILGVNEVLLQDSGLLEFAGEYAEYSAGVSAPLPGGAMYVPCTYWDRVFILVPPNGKNTITTGKVNLTKTAKELLTLCYRSPSWKCMQFCLDQWKEMGVTYKEGNARGDRETRIRLFTKSSR